MEYLKFSIVFIFILVLAPATRAENNKVLDLGSHTKFIYYDRNNKETTENECSSSKRYAMIVHGYRESCNQFWVRDLRQNLLTFRGGCVICMDYSAYNDDYAFMVLHFKAIVKILLNKVIELRNKSFHSRDAYFFGFSFGSRLITRALMDFGPKQIGTIHLCDPAGPGFDLHKGNAEPRLAALSSQCIHTNSKGHGTGERSCHQDWVMGDCGCSQSAEGPRPLGSHGLCPVFYNIAFRHKFLAVKKHKTCKEPINERDLTVFPDEGIRMGYFQNITNSAYNEVNLYAITKSKPPYYHSTL